MVEIVIGLNGPASSSPAPAGISAADWTRQATAAIMTGLFTIDPEGRIVEHSMYEGLDAVKLVNTIRASAPSGEPAVAH